MTGHHDKRDIEHVEFRFSTTIDVRFRDIDALGHVNNAVYLTYFEVARTAYLTQVQGYMVTPEDLSIVLAEASCRYRAPTLLNDKVTAEVTVIGMRSRSFELVYRLRASGPTGTRLVAEGYTLLVAIDRATMRVNRISRAIVEALESFEGRSLRGR